MDKKERPAKEGRNENEGGRATFHPESAAQEAMQEKVMLYQILQKHMESLTQNAVMVERRYEELEATRMALEDITKANESEILVPLGSGFFTYGKITDSKRMLADTGAGVFIDKDPESSKSLLEERKKEIEKLAQDMQNEMSDVSSRINSLAMDLEVLSQQQEHAEKKHKHD